MKNYTAENLRNIAIIGHGSEGKTTLTEAMLYQAGLIDRMGRVEDGTTTTDYDPEEIKRQISISTAFAPVEWKGCKINLIDVPGYFDFAGEMVQAMRLADAALIVVGAVSGVAVGTEKAWEMCSKDHKPRMIFVNQMDRENADFSKTLDELRNKFGNVIAPIQIPIISDGVLAGYVDVIKQVAMMCDAEGKHYISQDIPSELVQFAQGSYDEIVEIAAESSDELIEKFFDGQPLTEQEIMDGICDGIKQGRVAPVLAGAAIPNRLVIALLDKIVELMPSPKDMLHAVAEDIKSGDLVDLPCDENAPLAAQIIKTVADPFVGKLSIFRVFSGTVTPGMQALNSNANKSEKIGSVYVMRGKKQIEVDRIMAGDIGAVAKLQFSSTGDTLCAPSNPVALPPMEFPDPCISLAISVTKQGDEDKVFSGLARLEEEDPTFKIKKQEGTSETLISGMGELHLEVIIKKLASKFGAQAELKDPKVPYRETIRKSVKAEGKHKKQSGGHGQYGHCWIEFEPITDGSTDFEFVDKVVGGVVPRQYIPAVEKGLRENLPKGVLAGYPLVGIRATLYDGSYHSVDSSEMAFKTAARLALKNGCTQANPVLLEPIYRATVLVTDEYMGDIIGDMNRRRGRIIGMNPVGAGLQEVVAEVPLAEMFKYATDLRSMTQGRGSFRMEFERYEEVPSNIAQKVIENAKKQQEQDD